MSNFEKVFLGGVEQEDVALEALTLSIQVALQNSMAQNCVSQKELAHRLGVSPARVSQILRCHGGNLTLRTVAKVAQALGEDFELISKNEFLSLKQHSRRREKRSFERSLRACDRSDRWHDTSANDNTPPKRMAA